MSHSFRLMILAEAAVVCFFIVPLFVVAQDNKQPWHWSLLTTSVFCGISLIYMALRSYLGFHKNASRFHRDIFGSLGLLLFVTAVSMLWTGTFRFRSPLQRPAVVADYGTSEMKSSDPLSSVKKTVRSNKTIIAGCCIGVGFGVFLATAKGPFSQERFLGLSVVCGLIGSVVAEQLLAVLSVAIFVAVLFIVIRHGEPWFRQFVSQRAKPLSANEQKLAKLESQYKELQGNLTVAPQLKHEQLKRLRADIRAMGGRV